MRGWWRSKPAPSRPGWAPRASRRSTCSSPWRARIIPPAPPCARSGSSRRRSATRSSATSSARSGAVGLDASGIDLPANCRRTQPRWGASAKQALERALKEAARRGDRHIGCEHILLGLLRAEHGTVPRLLAAEGIDRDELTGRL
jgi:hypothetical protein